MQLNIFPNNLGSFPELGIYLLCTLSTDDMKMAFFSLITSKIVFCFLIAAHILSKDTMLSFLKGIFILITIFFFFGEVEASLELASKKRQSF